MRSARPEREVWRETLRARPGDLLLILFTEARGETVRKVRMGGELVPCQVKTTLPKGLLWALQATEDPLWRALQRLFGQSRKEVFSEVASY